MIGSTTREMAIGTSYNVPTVLCQFFEKFMTDNAWDTLELAAGITSDDIAIERAHAELMADATLEKDFAELLIALGHARAYDRIMSQNYEGYEPQFPRASLNVIGEGLDPIVAAAQAHLER